MNYAKNLMIEKNVALKYWKEPISIAVHTLNRVQLKKGSNQTPYELWYGKLLESIWQQVLHLERI